MHVDKCTVEASSTRARIPFSLEEKLENLDSLTLNYWLTKFAQEVANKNGGRYPPRSFRNVSELY